MRISINYNIYHYCVTIKPFRGCSTETINHRVGYLFTRLSQHSLGHVTGSRHSSSVSVSLIISVTAESDSDLTWKMSENKREIPSGLKKILDADVKISKDFVEFVNNKYPSNALRAHLKSLEISCHGIPW